MKLKVLFILLAMMVLSRYTSGQSRKIYQHYEQIWFQYFNQTRISEKWGLWFDAGYRTKDDLVKGTSTLLARVGAIYYLNQGTRLMGGYAFFNAYPLEDTIKIAQPEHRLWQQVQFQVEHPKLTMTNSIRFEQRWRQKIVAPDKYDNAFNFNYRLRFGINLQYPLRHKKNEKGDLSLVFGDEVMLNFGQQIVYNYLDQNRLFGGFKYYFNPDNSLVMLYMNSYSQTNVRALYRVFNVVRLSYLHNINVRKEIQHARESERKINLAH
ncbi:MAG TPA: DUF2490 domain-containing protein [Chitinophagaceae bacterium]|nr:DUF2490 domain-containing protein [Chitinophagaceae bacterium]